MLKSYASGKAKIQTHPSDEKRKITLQEVLYVLDAEYYLLSISKSAQNGCKVKFQNHKCNIEFSGHIILG